MAGEKDTNGTLTRIGGPEIMAPEADEGHVALPSQVQASRQQIRDSVELLEHRLQERLDWRAWVRNHPVEAVGIAFGVGVLLGARRYL
jgi:ElaB/YqjD/DUF883 family membrane-anchored ribosome-binding protein